MITLDLGCPVCAAVGRVPVSVVDCRYDCKVCGAAFLVHGSGVTILSDPRAQRWAGEPTTAARLLAPAPRPRPIRPSRSWSLSSFPPSWRRPRLVISGGLVLALGLLVPVLWPRTAGPGYRRVAGVVLCGSRPLGSGTVCFEPVAAPGYRAEGAIGPDGSFTVRTVPGSSRVSLVTGDKRVPARYGDPDSSGLLVSVTEGEGRIEPIVVGGLRRER